MDQEYNEVVNLVYITIFLEHSFEELSNVGWFSLFTNFVKVLPNYNNILVQRVCIYEHISYCYELEEMDVII